MASRLRCLGIGLLSISSSILGQSTSARAVSGDGSESPERYPIFAQLIKKTIVVITTKCENDPKEYTGTGFVVMHEIPELGSGNGFTYIITNKHVVLPHIETGAPCKVVEQTIRLNAKASNPENGGRNVLIKVDSPWLLPSDESVDLSITYFNFDQNLFDIDAFPTSMFATKDKIESEGVTEGDSVLYAGYFYQVSGTRQVEPIIRQGIIAMMPGELIMTTMNRPGRAYLADVHVFGGNSGSPLFVNVGGHRNDFIFFGSRYLLLGVISGMEIEESDINLQPTINYGGTFGANSGVSFVVPADDVMDLFSLPIIVRNEKQEVDKARAEGRIK